VAEHFACQLLAVVVTDGHLRQHLYVGAENGSCHVIDILFVLDEQGEHFLREGEL